MKSAKSVKKSAVKITAAQSVARKTAKRTTRKPDSYYENLVKTLVFPKEMPPGENIATELMRIGKAFGGVKLKLPPRT